MEMVMTDTKKVEGTTSLRDDEMTSQRRTGRRSVLGLLAAGGAVAGANIMTSDAAHAQAADVDNGNWTDSGSCPRGYGGIYTAMTDSDNGAITDDGGYGRGAPYC